MPGNGNIPHTNPDWNLELPDGDLNSLVDAHGTSHDDGYNFDEKDDEPTPEEIRVRDEARGKEALKAATKH